MSDLSNAFAWLRRRNRRSPLLPALTLPAVLLLTGLAFSTGAWAQRTCGRPAIFWNTGGGFFNDENNFTGSGGLVGCAPLATDNVTFGGTGFPQTGGIVEFPTGANVNYLDAASEGWTFSLGQPVTATAGLGFGMVSLLLEGGNVLSASATGSINGGTLIIPDKSGVTAGIFSINSLTMSGGGTITVLGGAVGSGANLFQVALSNQSNIDFLNNGPRASFVNIGSGTIDDSQVSMGVGKLNSVLWLAGENNNSTLTVSNGSVLTAQQLYVSAATNSMVTVTGSATRVNASSTNVYGGLTLANGAILSSGPLNLLAGAGGALTIQSGGQVTSTIATVTGNAASGPVAFNVTGKSSLWTIAGPMSVNSTNGQVAAGGQVAVAGAMTIAVTPPPTVEGSNPTDPTTGLHELNVTSVTVGNGGQLSASELTVGQAGYASLTIGGSAVINGSSTIASQSESEGDVILNDPEASWQSDEITVGDAGKGVVQINSGNVTTSADVIVGNQAGSKGTVSITAGTLAVGGSLTIGNEGTGMFSEEPTGTLAVTGETTVGDQTGSSGKMTLDGAFALGSSLIVGEATGSSGSVLMQLGATNSGGGVSLAKPQVILGDQADANGSLSLDGSGTAFTTSSLTVGSFGMGKLGLTNGALLVSSGPVRVGDQVTSLIDAVTVASLSNIDVNNTLDIGSVGIGTLTLTTGGKVTSVGALTLGDASSASGLVSVSGVQTGVASTINYQSALIVGNNGTGTLTVSGGGLVAPTAKGSGTFEVGADAGSTGTVSVSGVDATSGLAARLAATNLSVGGTSAAAGGTGKVTVGTGGALNVSNTLTVWKHGTVDVTGSGKVTVGTGAAAAAGTLRVDSGGTLTGPGTIMGNVVNAGGRVSPGDPVTLTIDGDYLQTSGILDLQVAGAGPGEADMLAATGDVQITGGVVDLEFVDGYKPTTGAQFDLFSGTDVELSRDVLEFNGGAATFDFSTTFDSADDTYVLTDTGPIGGGGTGPVPEPPTWMLALLGLGFLGLRRLRRTR